MRKRLLIMLCLVSVVGYVSASTMDFDVPAAAGEWFDGAVPNYGNRMPAAGGSATINMKDAAKAPVSYVVNYAAAGAEGGTPNIQADSAAKGKYWNTGYGDLTDVAFSSVSGSSFGWLYGFTPDAGYAIKFHSVQAGRYGGGTESNYVQFTLQKDDWSTLVYDSGQLSYPVDSDTHIDININHTGAIDEVLWIYVSGDDTDLYGFDNLVISQVPEPATMALLGLGALVLCKSR